MIEYIKGNYYKCAGLPGLVELVNVEGDNAQIRYRGMVIKISLSKLTNL
jgi:hypothetical protein